jgi:HSP20 family molecular chaperone IbpA
MYLTTSPLFAPVVRRRPALDTTFDRALTALARSYGDVGHRVEGSWNDGTYQLTVDLPGTPEEAVGVSVAGRTLTITVAGEGDSTWTRRLRLAQTLDPEQVSARYVNGRLTVTVGAIAAPESRTIAIDTTPVTPALEASETVAADQSNVDNVSE